MCYVCVCVLETQKLTCVNMCATCVHNFLNMCVRVVYFWKKYGKFGLFVVFYTCFHTVLSPIFHFLVCNKYNNTKRTKSCVEIMYFTCVYLCVTCVHMLKSCVLCIGKLEAKNQHVYVLCMCCV